MIFIAGAKAGRTFAEWTKKEVDGQGKAVLPGEKRW